MQFQNDDGCRCLLVGMRECQDVASVAPLRAEATADKMTLMFDACSFEILSSTGFTSDEKDLDQINLFELATGSSRTSLVSAIQSAVNSFEGTKQEHYLGSLELLGRVAQATLTLQKDDLLNTLIGTLDVTPSLERNLPAKSKLRARSAERKKARKGWNDDRSGSILDLRKEAVAL
ncbi:unnamed protein product [Effrenium voratum]|nr:unnamed protein product [Effrenium voratum]